MIPHPLQLFSPHWFEPVDTRTQVDRMPGTADAACLCETYNDHLENEACFWPFCGWCKPPQPDPRPEGTT